jgi:hypothetical protein
MNKVEGYKERKLELEGWQVNLTSYKLGEVYHAKADNVSPGASIARATAPTRLEAEQQALEKARKHLSHTRRMTA